MHTYGPQWHRLGIGSSVTATVWNGEVEEVSDNGGSEIMKTNPIWKAGDKRLTLTGLESLILVCLCVATFEFIGAGKRDEKQWKRQSGNNTAP